MALPPSMPLGNTKTYFDFLREQVSNDFQQQNINGKHFELNFEGLNDLLTQYNYIDYGNTELCAKFSKSFNLWAVYVSLLKNLSKKFWLDSSSIRIAKTAVASKLADEKSVANGDRCANKEKAVVDARCTENSFESFHGALNDLEDFLTRCHYEVKMFCELNISNKDITDTAENLSTPETLLPPSTPFSWGDATYLDYFVALVKSDFNNYGIELNFTGISALCKEYLDMDYNNLNSCGRISRDFNMWSSYVDSLESSTKKLYLDAETKKTQELSIASFLHGGKNKSQGERLANMDEKVIQARKTRNSFDAFHGCLESLEQFLVRSHYEIKFFAEIHNPRLNGK